MNHKIFLLYDGISNSVFQGQVLAPLKKQLSENPDLRITLVTFERDTRSFAHMPRYNFFDSSNLKNHSARTEGEAVHPGINIIVFKKLPFFGEMSLWPAVYRFGKLYKKLYDTIGVNELVARGPFAGWIARKSVGVKRAPDRLIIQARGLAAEEFRYTNRKPKFLYKLYSQIEFEAYASFGLPTMIKIETVSPALKEYLERHFYVNPENISVSYKDIPERILREQIAKWRKEVRAELSIDPDAYVYCYAGSAHSWQGIEEMVDYFVKQREKNKNSVLIIFSQDEKVFRQKLRSLKKDCYRIKNIPHSSVARYLSAGDAGLLFRDEDTINWVSRPTKMLEYQSVGLKVVHNNTIAWLCQNC